MQNIILTTKHYVSLAAIMLLAPIVPFAVRANEVEVSEDDMHFIHGYIKYGWYILAGVITAGILSLIDQFVFDHNAIEIVSYSILVVCILMIFFGIFTIIHDTPIWNQDGKIQTKIDINNKLLLYYIPLYNVYTRYTHPIDKETYRWKKESVGLWALLLLITVIIPSAWTVLIGVSIILWRSIGLFLGFDVIPLSTKQNLNKLFVKHPEEFISYIIWYLIPKKKTTFLEEENIYGLGRSVKNIRALLETIIILGGYGRLVTTRYISENYPLRILITPTVYILRTFLIRIKTQNLSYKPLIDHIVRLFTFKKA